MVRLVAKHSMMLVLTVVDVHNDLMIRSSSTFVNPGPLFKFDESLSGIAIVQQKLCVIV